MAGRPAKVGIAVVTYNASLAARVTLASLRRADNAASSTLVLVDNASRAEDRALVRAAVERHVAAADLPWRHVQQETNLGFSGGNNVAIRILLDDPSVTHVCLLNSDVIVPHHWLDRLLAAGQEVTSGVTNKAESEQCVPIDYDLALEDCLDGEADRLRDGVFETVDDFAGRWHRAWRGNVVDCDATFFCVLISRAAIERIGLLDERFFPGGYEDDDYCARTRAAGLAVHLARDTFVHHWGSASFGELRRDYFQENATRNRGYLEQKHDFTWRARPEKPFVAYAQDVAFAASGRGDRALQRGFHKLYGRTLRKLVVHYAGEFRNLHGAVRAGGLQMPADLDAAVAAAAAHGDLPDEWRALFDRASRGAFAAAPSPIDSTLATDLGRLCAKIHDVATCNFAIARFLEVRAPATPPQLAARPWWRRSWSLLRHGVPMLLGLRGIVFFGGYPYAPRDHDGYFQRIRAIDAMFADRWRIYFDPDPLPGQTTWYDLPAPRTLVLRASGGRLRAAFAVLAVWLCAVRCRTVYFHSVLRMEDLGWGRLFRRPWFRKVLDVHGVVPEEFRMHGDWYHAVRFERHEELAAQRAHVVIVVTESMRRYLTQKYRDRLRGRVVVLPIFPAIDVYEAQKPLVGGSPAVVYAGGLQKWQQVPKMIEAIVATSRICAHRFYCPDPQAVLAMLPRDLLADGACDIVVERKTHEELLDAYRECHYGFLLREDSVVNHVACPTKLVEYLAMGIVPIVDCEAVGDFASLGMRVVRLADFTAGRLPDASERDAMARANFGVYGRLRGQREAGAAQLRELLGPGPAAGSLSSRLLWQAAKLLPPSTRRGKVARTVWYGLRGRPAAASAAPVSGAAPAEIAPCDVLVQVGNFLAGGLENAVLDLNEAFRAAGLRVGMLVLGEQGSAAARARAQGVPICASPYSDEAYRQWLRAASPKLVMSHYSVEGAAICAEMGVPLVQVIHNIYLWLHGAELAAMRASAAHTTAFVAASSFALDYSVRRLGFPAGRCVVIPYGIDVRRFRELDVAGARRHLRAQLGLAPDAFVFLNVGAINHQKNHLSQLRAFHACAAACPDAHLVVVGPVYEQELLNDCRNYVTRHGLTDRVTFTGGVSDPHRYYAMADALVHTAFFEGGPLALLEALAANLPVVTVATGLAVHFAGRKGITLVTPHFDVVDYRGHINEMRSSPATEQALAAAMAKVYRERERPDLPAAVVDAFDKDSAYRLYVELVQGLIAHGTAAPELARSWSDRLAETG